MRFYLPGAESPTFYNLRHYLKILGWQAEDTEKDADFSEKTLDFHEKAAICLEYKHLLAKLVAQNCPELMPMTYGINDSNWPEVLAQVSDFLIWILKPSLLNNGQSIRLFNNLEALALHYSKSNRLGGEHVLQQYISNPHLLRDARKYSIRHFMLLTNFMGAYVYPDGYCNVSRFPYRPNDLSHLPSHITNEHLNEQIPNVIQIPTREFDFYQRVYPQIINQLTKLVGALNKQYPEAFFSNKEKKFAIFGVDFMIDANGRLWLLEVNHGPCFPTSEDHPLQKCLYEPFWQAVIEHFVLPAAGGAALNSGCWTKIS